MSRSSALSVVLVPLGLLAFATTVLGDTDQAWPIRHQYLSGSGGISLAPSGVPLPKAINLYSVDNRLLGWASVAYGLYRNDEAIGRWVQKNRSDDSANWSKSAEYFGRRTVLLPLAGAYVLGTVSGNTRFKQASIAAIAGYGLGQFTTTALKNITGRQRPNTHDPYDTWSDGGLSFPSGHSTTAFSIATAFATIYHDEPAVPVISYGIAGLTALSRVHDDAHWASDIFVGSLVGYYSTKYALRWMGYDADYADKDDKSRSTIIIGTQNNAEIVQFLIEYKF